MGRARRARTLEASQIFHREDDMFRPSISLILFLLADLTLAPSSSIPAQTVSGRMAYLDNGIIRIGVDSNRGGSIGYFARSRNGQSVVNIHDFGRWIGQSYYSGPRPFGEPHPNWKGWPWNPVSGGDVFGHSSRLLKIRNDGQTLYVKSRPMQWALNGVPADCTFETWITLDGKAAHVRNRLTNNRPDRTQYPAMDQELPALYTIGKLHRLFTYDSDKPFSNAALREIPKLPARGGMPQWTNFSATEHWAALTNDKNWGLGVFNPDVVRFLGGFHGNPDTGGPDDDPTGYIAPVCQEILDHNIVYEYRYTLILDSLTSIRQYVYDHRPRNKLPDYRFEKDRQHWWFINAEDTGQPTNTSLRLKVEKNDPQMIGPETLWDAQDVPKLYIRAAYRTRQKRAELFWQTRENPGFASGRSASFTIEPDGMFHTYEVDLSISESYRGKMTGLRFDPVEAGAPGDFVDIAFISSKKE